MFENASWITLDSELDCFSIKKTFSFRKPIENVEINITAIGWYHLYINSKRIDKDIFSPSWTQFNKRVQYQNYIIKCDGKKKFLFSCELSRGWGGSNHMAWVKLKPTESIYFQKSLIYEFKVNFKDGSSKIVSSGEPLKCYKNEIARASIYGGEEQNPFAKRKYLGKTRTIDIKTKLIPQEGERIVEGERFKAKRLFKDKAGNTVIDFGQNFAGYVELTVNGKKGDVISFVPAEVIDPDGVVYTDNYREATSLMKYTLLDGKHTYKPRFTYGGGRYIKLIDFPSYIKKENFVGVFVHADIKKTNSFKCGHKLLNRLYLNQVYGQLSNYLEVPTDCPQRNERLGWTADTQVFSKTACINFNVEKFLTKYVNELKVCQGKNGYIPKFVPTFKYEDEQDPTHKEPIIGWSDACIIVPYEIYRAYGNKKILIDSYEMMNKYFKFYLKTFDKKFISKFDNVKHGPDAVNQQYGDWCATDKIQIGFPKGLTRVDLIALAYLAYDLQILIEVEKVLGKNTKEKEILLNKIKKAYQKNFIKKGHMVGEKVHLFSNQERSCYTQTGLVMTLKLDLCKEEDKKSLAKDLVDLIKECGGKMTVGFLGTPWILEALSKNGYTKEAYSLLLNEEFPSWLYSVKMGATTIWEHYDCINEFGEMLPPDMNSFNHYAYGSFYVWVFNNTLGINPLEPGYKKVLISPKPDKRLGFAKGEFVTKYGTIKVSWKYNKEGKVNYNVVVPKGIDAIIKLSNKFNKTIVDGGKISL